MRGRMERESDDWRKQAKNFDLGKEGEPISICYFFFTFCTGTPIVDMAIQSLHKEGICEVEVFDAVGVEPSDHSVQQAIEFALNGNFDGFVSLGGGSGITCFLALPLSPSLLSSSTDPDYFISFFPPPFSCLRPLPYLPLLLPTLSFLLPLTPSSLFPLLSLLPLFSFLHLFSPPLLSSLPVIDTTKIANLYSTYPVSDFTDYILKPYGSGKNIPGKLKPHIACPTTCGTGSLSRLEMLQKLDFFFSAKKKTRFFP
jgi:hypothetical protein